MWLFLYKIQIYNSITFSPLAIGRQENISGNSEADNQILNKLKLCLKIIRDYQKAKFNKLRFLKYFDKCFN